MIYARQCKTEKKKEGGEKKDADTAALSRPGFTNTFSEG